MKILPIFVKYTFLFVADPCLVADPSCGRGDTGAVIVTQGPQLPVPGGAQRVPHVPGLANVEVSHQAKYTRTNQC